MHDYSFGPAPTQPPGNRPDPLVRVKTTSGLRVILLGPWWVAETHAPHRKQLSQLHKKKDCPHCAKGIPKRRKYYASCARQYQEGSAKPGWRRVVLEITEGAVDLTYRKDWIGKAIFLKRQNDKPNSKVLFALDDVQPPEGFRLPFHAGPVQPTVEYVYDTQDRLERPVYTTPEAEQHGDGLAEGELPADPAAEPTPVEQPQAEASESPMERHFPNLARRLAAGIAEQTQLPPASSNGHANGKAVR